MFYRKFILDFEKGKCKFNENKYTNECKKGRDIVGALFMSSIYLILGIFCVIGLIKHFYFEKKIRCISCSQKIDFSSVKCQHCGTFIEKKVINQKKMFKYMQRSVEGVQKELLNQRKRD